MGTLFPSSLELSLDRFEYKGWAEVPNVRFIDIVFDKVAAQPRIKEGLLHKENIEAWLDKVCSDIRELGPSNLSQDFGHEDESTRAGGLRLVYLYPCRRVIKAYNICNLTDTPLRLLEDDVRTIQSTEVWLPRETLRSILQHFNLPPQYLSTKLGSAARSAIVESRSDIGHRLLCRTTGNSKKYMSLSKIRYH